MYIINYLTCKYCKSVFQRSIRVFYFFLSMCLKQKKDVLYLYGRINIFCFIMQCSDGLFGIIHRF